MPSEKIDKLDKLQIMWDVFEEQWQEKYQELKEFYDKEGHTNVLANKSILGSWVQTQRTYYKKQKLSQEKIKLLESLDFQWQIIGK